ncbi:NAD-dependent epimerase/dehydratase family protein [Arsenicicoccus piscis]|uniref:NAD-dependent epimerase/dehydratase domain-containing protein n=1 Tax=Arsenicicoccus piscis TaxID=673954 RepID=A0ABQ6HI17_9MICO|nr:NAD-dependent epimerase/dehydratase family protein [Arsenicicoccus piscis]MCH8627680.1 NAD-dependent epimerase/dehydratase family protein [Arsenicicoccus piscis]GMA18181.1 hypothetical protein GCM10025862_02020 [Arsenicicoccus piscis]
MANVVLVTGVSRLLGGLVARELARREDVGRVIGIDVVPPRRDLSPMEFVRADIRNPVIAKIVDRYGVDTVVHAGVIATPVAAGGRSSQKEINVIGTMQLLAACQKSETVQRLVVKSTGAIYGAAAADPAAFVETHAPTRHPEVGFARDSIEVEGYVRGLARRRPDLEVSVLRLANVVGPTISTALTDYFSLPVLPVPLGYDGRLQFLHEQDAVASIVHAAVGDRAQIVGVTNVAGDGVITVAQAGRFVRRPLLPVPLGSEGLWVRGYHLSGMAELHSGTFKQLAYGRVLDTDRMRTVLGFEPRWTTREAFRSFAATAGLTLPGVDLAGSGLRRLRTTTSAMGLGSDVTTTPGGRG